MRCVGVKRQLIRRGSVPQRGKKKGMNPDQRGLTKGAFSTTTGRLLAHRETIKEKIDYGRGK